MNESTYKLLIQTLAVIMFILAIALLLNYINEYNNIYSVLDKLLIKDTVIIKAK